MARYARVERLLRELESACRRGLGRRPSLLPGRRRAPDEALTHYDAHRLEESVRTIEPLLLELQLFTAARHSVCEESRPTDALAHYRSHLSELREPLRPQGEAGV